MSQTYSQIQAQIAKLQTAAETLRKAELAEVIAKIRVAISAYDLTPEDLFGAKSRKPATARRVADRQSVSKSTGDRTPRFADGAGNAWVGRGPRPRWLREALAAGKPLSDFAVAGGARTPSIDVSSAPAKASKKVAAKAKVKATKKRVAVKYRDETGNSWTGRGSRPKWFKEALAAGKSPDQFLV